jgi:hypothetical protein
MAESKIRVYALARELGVEVPVILDMARRLACEEINQLSLLNAKQRAQVTAALANFPRAKRSPSSPTGPCISAHSRLLSGVCPWCGRIIKKGKNAFSDGMAPTLPDA